MQRIIFINLMVFLGLISLTECVLQLVFSFSTDERLQYFASYDQLKSEGLNPVYAPHRYLGYYPAPGYKNGKNRHNSMGFRGDEIAIPKPAGLYRIACLGGSTTYSTGIRDYTRAYPYLLQTELNKLGLGNFEVVNAGAGAWTTWESLINLQLRVLDLDPDMIVIYHSLNDIHARLVWPPELYRGDNSGRRKGVFRPYNSWGEFICEKSNIMRIVAIALAWKNSNTTLSILDKYPKSLYLYEFKRQYESGSYPSGLFTETPVARMLEVNKPIYFRRNIEGMIDIARRRNIDVVLTTFAISDQFGSLFVNSPEYKAAEEEQNAIIRKIAAVDSVALFDFATLFPDDKRLYKDGRHVNEKGSALKSRMFAEFIRGLMEKK